MCKDKVLEGCSLKIHSNIMKREHSECIGKYIMKIPNLNDNDWMKKCPCLKKRVLELLVIAFSKNDEYVYNGALCNLNTTDEYVWPLDDQTDIPYYDEFRSSDVETSKIIELFCSTYIRNQDVGEKELFSLRVLYSQKFFSKQLLSIDQLKSYELDVLKDIKAILNSLGDKIQSKRYIIDSIKRSSQEDFSDNGTFELIRNTLKTYSKIYNGGTEDVYSVIGDTLYCLYDQIVKEKKIS